MSDKNLETLPARRRGPKFKLTRDQMLAVKTAHLANEETIDEIAGRFKVTKQTIYNVLRRLSAEEAAS